MHLTKDQTLDILEQNHTIKEGINTVVHAGQHVECTIPHLVIRSLLRSDTIVQDEQSEVRRYKLNPKKYTMKQYDRYLINIPMIDRYLCHPNSRTAKIYHRHRKNDLREMARDLHQFEGEVVALTPARDVEIHDGMRYTNTRISGAELRLQLAGGMSHGGHPLDAAEPAF